MTEPGTIVVLNGAPRSGKTSICRALQETRESVWMNLGVDLYAQATPSWLLPGIGLRPGGERPDLEPYLPALYLALYESAAAHSRRGLNVAMDLGHHNSYSRPLGLLPQCARILEGLPAMLVGVECPLSTIAERRAASERGKYVVPTPGEPTPEPVLAWQREVHRPGIYDLVLDTSISSPAECAQAILDHLRRGLPRPSAFERLAKLMP